MGRTLAAPGLCWGTLHQAGLVEMIELAARFGFPTLAIPPFVIADCQDGGTSDQALRRRLRDAGVSVRVIDCIQAGFPGMPTRPITFQGRSIEQASNATCFAAAAVVEAPIINVSPFGGGPVSREAVIEWVGALCREAAEFGITIALEFMPNTVIPDLATADAIVQASGAANCGTMLDTWHFVRSGGSLDELSRLRREAIAGLQLSDRIAPAPGETYRPMSGRSLPGEGELPLHSIVSAVLAKNPNITAEVEVFSDSLGSLTAEEAALRTANALAAWRFGGEP
jgi:sugar phosphate isomerase/epimerase